MSHASLEMNRSAWRKCVDDVNEGQNDNYRKAFSMKPLTVFKNVE